MGRARSNNLALASEINQKNGISHIGAENYLHFLNPLFFVSSTTRTWSCSRREKFPTLLENFSLNNNAVGLNSRLLCVFLVLFPLSPSRLLLKRGSKINWNRRSCRDKRWTYFVRKMAWRRTRLTCQSEKRNAKDSAPHMRCDSKPYALTVSENFEAHILYCFTDIFFTLKPSITHS